MNALQAIAGRVRLWLSLVRFSHTLFALPFALGALVVAEGGAPRPRVALLVLACMVTARNAAMAFNRLADHKFDAENPRTKRRHLPAGLVTPGGVACFVALNGALFVLAAFGLNDLCGILAFPTLATLCGYSLLKRFTWAAHIGLGIAEAIAPCGAWLASRGELEPFPLLLGGIVLLWIAGFDIIYATQDADVDRATGLHSIPQRFGIPGALRFALVLHLLMLALGWATGFLCALPWPWDAAFAVATLAILYEHLFRKSPSLDALNQDFFLANIVVSVAMMLGMFAMPFVG